MRQVLSTWVFGGLSAASSLGPSTSPLMSGPICIEPEDSFSVPTLILGYSEFPGVVLTRPDFAFPERQQHAGRPDQRSSGRRVSTTHGSTRANPTQHTQSRSAGASGAGVFLWTGLTHPGDSGGAHLSFLRIFLRRIAPSPSEMTGTPSSRTGKILILTEARERGLPRDPAVLLGGDRRQRPQKGCERPPGQMSAPRRAPSSSPEGKPPLGAGADYDGPSRNLLWLWVKGQHPMAPPRSPADAGA